MKSTKIILFLCLPLLLGACKGKGANNAAGVEILSGYFFKNTHTIDETSFFVFSGKASFDDYLGVGRTMGNTVDEPDFDNSIVAAIACPPVKNNTEIVITKIERPGETVDISYEIKTGKAISFTMQPVTVFSFAKDGNIRTVRFNTGGKTVKEITVNRQAAGAPKTIDDLNANFTGTFSGLLPCADCPGILTTLTLNADGTYALEMVYQGKGDGKKFTRQGKWTPSEDLAIIELDYDKKESPAYYALIDKNTLEQLDANAQPIVSDLNFKLVRK